VSALVTVLEVVETNTYEDWAYKIALVMFFDGATSYQVDVWSVRQPSYHYKGIASLEGKRYITLGDAREAAVNIIEASSTATS
jgi:hypothetical protein